MSGNQSAKKAKTKNWDYSGFSRVDGRHPIQKISEDCFVNYSVRHRKGGRVCAFNFDLAREMGLIPQSHESEINADLESAVLESFGIVIINEYDQINKTKIDPNTVKEHPHMATRYLQLQHPDKRGLSSGDGRSIWNGTYKGRGCTWDISSCGTGATRLSPATSLQNKFFKTGDTNVSYGCGYSELDEGLGTIIFSEILHSNNLPTERVLAVIQYGKDLAITVRAHKNLLRPSHLFMHLKQSNYDTLKGLLDYYIDRQEKNGEWQDVPSDEKGRYNYFLDQQLNDFAKVSADFEDQYIFCWVDWDGDNILMDGGIIDYGSVRQFGLFHSEYRYDDHDRFSTSLTEQKSKFKYMFQTSIQMVDYLLTHKKRPIKNFAKHTKLAKFESVFRARKLRNLAWKIGFNDDQIDFLCKNKSKSLKLFEKSFRHFERAKSIQGPVEVNDGINWNAIFCTRDLLREIPQIYMQRRKPISPEEFIEIARSNYALPVDLELSSYRRKMSKDFQFYYFKLIADVAKHEERELNAVLTELIIRSSIINKYERVTGDCITIIVEKIIGKASYPAPCSVNAVLEDLKHFQCLDPDKIIKHKRKSLSPQKTLHGLLRIVRDYREGL